MNPIHPILHNNPTKSGPLPTADNRTKSDRFQNANNLQPTTDNRTYQPNNISTDLLIPSPNYNNNCFLNLFSDRSRQEHPLTEYVKDTEEELVREAAQMGRLMATKKLFSRLARAEAGTPRTERMASDLWLQNCLRHLDPEVKKNPELQNPEARRRLVATLLRTQESLIENNIKIYQNSINTKTNRLLKAGGFALTGNHRRKLDQKIRSSRETAFNKNWEEKYDQKYEYLVKNRDEERQNYSPDNEMAELDPFYGTYLEGTKLEDKIKFSDVEIEKEEEKRGEKAKNYVVLGTIVPPLTKEEIFVLELDPKLAIESQITKEDISIAVEEGKVKRMWGQMNEVNDVLEDGTVEEATPEERLRAEEQENELRRLTNKIMIPRPSTSPIVRVQILNSTEERFFRDAAKQRLSLKKC